MCKLPGSWIPFAGVREFALCIFSSRISSCDWLHLRHMNLVSISGIFMKLMKVRDIELGGLVEWFSGRKSKTRKDFLCLLIFSWARIFRSRYFALEVIPELVTHRKLFWFMCQKTPKYFSTKPPRWLFPHFCNFGCAERAQRQWSLCTGIPGAVIVSRMSSSPRAGEMARERI